MLETKEYVVTGGAPAKAPVVLNEDGTVSVINPAGVTEVDGFEWLSKVKSKYKPFKAVYDAFKKQIWVLTEPLSNYSRLIIYELKGRRLVEVATQAGNPFYVYLNDKNADLVFDPTSKQVIVAWDNRSASGVTHISGFKESNGTIENTFSDTTGTFNYNPRFFWCELRQCVVLLSTQFSSSPNLIGRTLSFSESGITVISSVTYSSVAASDAQVAFDQSTASFLFAYTNHRTLGTQDYYSLIRGMVVNSNKTLSLGSPRQLYHANSQGPAADKATVLYHAESNHWLTECSHGNKRYAMDSSGNLTDAGVISQVTDYQYFRRDPASGKYLKFVNKKAVYLNLSASGEFEGVTNKESIAVQDYYGNPIKVDNDVVFYLVWRASGDEITYGLFDPAGKTTTVTSDNFIGFTPGAVTAPGSKTKINLSFGTPHQIPVSSNDLELSKDYYIDFDGSLITEDAGYGYAGFSISNDTLLIKGKRLCFLF